MSDTADAIVRALAVSMPDTTEGSEIWCTVCDSELHKGWPSWDEHRDDCAFRRAVEYVRQAENPTHTDLMVSPESIECTCSKNGCPLHDNGPCSICSRPFSECACTGEQQAKAFEDAYRLSPEAQASLDAIAARGTACAGCGDTEPQMTWVQPDGNFCVDCVVDRSYEMPTLRAIVRDLAAEGAPMCTDGDGMHCAILSCYALLESPHDSDPSHHVPSCPWRRAVEHLRGNR